MVLPIRILSLAVLALALASSGVRAQTPVPDALKTIFADLAQTASPAQYQQILGAVNASPQLATELTILATRRKLTAIAILPGTTTSPSPYRAWTERASIVFYGDFLEAQLDNRKAGVAYPDDILPNNTVFCLGHLAHHLAVENAPSLGDNVAVYRRQHFDREAGAFIQGWNNVVDAAVHGNGGRPLSRRQAGQLLLNMRYRFALMKVEMPPTGFLEATPKTSPPSSRCCARRRPRTSSRRIANDGRPQGNDAPGAIPVSQPDLSQRGDVAAPAHADGGLRLGAA